MKTTQNSHLDETGDKPPLNFLDQSQVTMIDEALSAIGDYGELRLIVEKGRLRFLITQKSFDALKWQSGSIMSTQKENT
jgi:hypothetical protein